MALFNHTPLYLPIKYDQSILDRFYKQIISSVPRIATYETTVDVPLMAIGTTTTVTNTVTGITTEDIIFVNQPDLGGIRLVSYRVVSNNTIDLFFWNPTGVAIDPAPSTFKLVSIRR